MCLVYKYYIRAYVCLGGIPISRSNKLELLPTSLRYRSSEIRDKLNIKGSTLILTSAKIFHLLIAPLHAAVVIRRTINNTCRGTRDTSREKVKSTVREISSSFCVFEGQFLVNIFLIIYVGKSSFKAVNN